MVANQQIEVAFENEVLAVVDGKYGFGQSIGEQATQLGIDKCTKHGVSVIALRNTGHLGRIGDWPTMAANAGLMSLHFVNTSGAGILVAPFGGINRRLSANPVAAGVPVEGGPPIIMDMSCCTIAEGKLRVAFNKGVDVPEGCIIDSNGRPDDRSQSVLRRSARCDPVGRRTQGLCPGRDHRDAGRLAHRRRREHAGQERPAGQRHVVDLPGARTISPSTMCSPPTCSEFVDWVKSSEKVTPDGQILMPGEIEQQTKAKRLRDGIELDANTWQSLVDVGQSLSVPVESV